MRDGDPAFVVVAVELDDAAPAAPISANATYPPDVLGVSYYGEDANGYRPWEMAESARWMRALP